MSPSPGPVETRQVITFPWTAANTSTIHSVQLYAVPYARKEAIKKWQPCDSQDSRNAWQLNGKVWASSHPGGFQEVRTHAALDKVLLEASTQTHWLLLNSAYLKCHLASWHSHTQAQTHNVRPSLVHHYLNIETKQWLALGSSLSPKILDWQAVAPYQVGAVFNSTLRALNTKGQFVHRQSQTSTRIFKRPERLIWSISKLRVVKLHVQLCH